MFKEFVRNLFHRERRHAQQPVLAERRQSRMTSAEAQAALNTSIDNFDRTIIRHASRLRGTK